MYFHDDGNDNKGDDNKASAKPGDINNLGDDIGTRIGQGSDEVEGEGHMR
jgi:hypothetical protein